MSQPKLEKLLCGLLGAGNHPHPSVHFMQGYTYRTTLLISPAVTSRKRKISEESSDPAETQILTAGIVLCT